MADKEINPVLIIVVIILAVLFFRFSPLSVIFGSPWGSYSVSPDAEVFVQYFGNMVGGWLLLLILLTLGFMIIIYFRFIKNVGVELGSK